MADSSSRIGQTISHYCIVEKLGGGGMGVVYEANRLSQDMFALGSHLVVIATRRRVTVGKLPSWLCIDEGYGAIPATDPNVAAIKQLLSSMRGIADTPARSRGSKSPVYSVADSHVIVAFAEMIHHKCGFKEK